ncbi:acyl-coenzyme A diphosphatase NUDT19-like [Lucilia cuprina]|uniref:acyl-coenzyme A diphosphatase NUDT19-like n=1 Tax=Lucilia cuprina TaxID=7375 RepID=UPI001F06E73D|nr:acyl-coenzyme A diphosphatase NUDT19-like [Lucilia cuprina]
MAKQMAIKFRKSASLIVLAKHKLPADSQANFKALLLNRHEKASFMPNSSVFPGGVCEAADETPLWHKHFEKMGVTKTQIKPLTAVKGEISNIFKNDNKDVLERELSLRITAIRETFEELGIILCRDRKSLSSPDGKGYGNFKEDFDRKHWQNVVHNDASKFLSLCEELDVVPDLWSLYEWSNWFTPSTFKKRFDTAFFMVALENMPEVLAEEHEVTNYAWKTPAEYLKAYFNKEIWLPPPQFYELSRLLNFTELEKVKEFAQKRSTEGSIVILPVQYKLKNGQVSVLPGDDLYPDDPNASDKQITIEKDAKEFREGVKNIHRLEFYSPHDAVVRQNYTPSCGHMKPLNANPKQHD